MRYQMSNDRPTLGQRQKLAYHFSEVARLAGELQMYFDGYTADSLFKQLKEHFALDQTETKELEENGSEDRFFATQDELQMARDLYGSNDIEVDDFYTRVSVTEDGAWVQGWLWVKNEDENEDEEEA